MENKITRRQFMGRSLLGATSVVGIATVPLFGFYTTQENKLAILGGQPVRNKPFNAWPV